MHICDSLIQSERVLMTKEMRLLSVSILLHLSFFLCDFLSCIFKENLGLITLSLSYVLLVLSEAAFAVIDRHTIVFLSDPLVTLKFIVSIYVVPFCFRCSKLLNIFFFLLFFPFDFFIISLTSTQFDILCISVPHYYLCLCSFSHFLSILLLENN